MCIEAGNGFFPASVRGSLPVSKVLETVDGVLLLCIQNQQN